MLNSKLTNIENPSTTAEELIFTEKNRLSTTCAKTSEGVQTANDFEFADKEMNTSFSFDCSDCLNLKNQILESDKRFELILAENDNLKIKYSKLQTSHQEVIKNVQDLTENSKTEHTCLENIKSELEEKLSDIQKLNCELENFKNDSQNFNCEKQSLLYDIDRFKKELSAIKATNSELSQKIEEEKIISYDFEKNLKQKDHLNINLNKKLDEATKTS